MEKAQQRPLGLRAVHAAGAAGLEGQGEEAVERRQLGLPHRALGDRRGEGEEGGARRRLDQGGEQHLELG